MGIIELLNQVITKPTVLGINKVEDIHVLITGYNIGSEGGAYPLLDEFNKYVQNEYESKHPWDRLIRLHAGNDADSVKLFAKHFMLFMQAHN